MARTREAAGAGRGAEGAEDHVAAKQDVGRRSRLDATQEEEEGKSTSGKVINILSRQSFPNTDKMGFFH